jgi:DNA-binding NtrC family response regulator
VPPPQRPASSRGRRIVICDYNQLLQSVTGLLRMSGYAVFQAYDGRAARELCAGLDGIELLVLNTFGTGIDPGDLIHEVRQERPGLPVLHIGNTVPASLPPDVPTLAEDFTADSLLLSVEEVIAAGALGQR